MHFESMRQITSSDNRICKIIRQLGLRKHREKLGLYLIEGENLMEEAFKNNAETEFIAVNSDRLDYYSSLFGDRLRGSYEMPAKLFNQLADTESSQGIMAAVRIPQLTQEQFADRIAGGNVIVLDRLQDPGNTGTVLRTCDAAGYRGAVMIRGTADIYSPKAVRAAAGSVFRIPAYYTAGAREGVKLLKGAGLQIIGTGFDTDNMYYDVDMRRNTAVVIGNEGNGISEEMKALCDRIVKIPMHGSIESLNAAVAAGILIYESIRQER